MISLLLGIYVTVSLHSGCAVNPVSGRPEAVLISVEKEKELGAEEAKKVEKSMGLVTDPEIVAYVEAIGQRLAKHSPKHDVSYTFKIVDMELPNAFALPGGHVYVSRGLLALVNSEDELAGVMGHEIGHVAGRHAVQRLTRVAATSPIRVATGLAGAAVGVVAPKAGSAISDAGQLASALVIAPHSREQEHEADDVGQKISASAGWNPEGLTSLLKSLGREEKLRSDDESQSSFFDTHPATDERVANTKERASQLKKSEARPIANDRAALLAKLDGLLVGSNPDNGVFNGNEFVQPVLDFFISFPAGWEKQNTNEAIVAQAPGKKALIVLRVAGKGNNPVAVVKQIEEKHNTKILEKASQTQINGLPAVHLNAKMKTEEGVTGIILTWISHRGLVYQVTAMSPVESFGSYREAFIKSITSFRPLAEVDWPKILETRLRIVQARNGETLQDLEKRSGSVWTPGEIAVANGLAENDPLSDGQLIKVAILEPYQSKKR
jgi:predicted Zn-dependent protease